MVVFSAARDLQGLAVRVMADSAVSVLRRGSVAETSAVVEALGQVALGSPAAVRDPLVDLSAYCNRFKRFEIRKSA